MNEIELLIMKFRAFPLHSAHIMKAVVQGWREVLVVDL